MSQEVIEITEREIEVIEVVEKGPLGPIGPVGPQANINYTVVTANQTLTNSQNIAADTSGGSFTLTLPASPNAGDSIDIFDYANTFDTNPLTIARNGQNIESLAENLTANVEGAYFTLIYTGATRGWQILPRYGVSGIEDVLSAQGDILYRGASSETRLPIGAAGQVLKVNSGATAPEWGTISGSISVTGSDLTLSGATGTPITNATLATTGVGAGTYTKVTVDTKGRVTTGATATPADIGAAATSHTHDAADVTTGTFDNARINFAAPSSIGSTTPAAISGTTGTFSLLTASDSNATSDLSYVLVANRTTTRLFGVRDDGVAEAISFRIPNNPGANVTATIDSAGLKLRDTNYVGFSSTANIFSLDTFLRRDAAGTLAQYNGLNPQTFRIYGQLTGTDTSATGNYERGFMRWSAAGGVFQIGTEKGSGGGTARNLEFQTDGATRFYITTGGNFVVGNGDGNTQASAAIVWQGNARISATNTFTGVITLGNRDNNGFNRLQFGGTTSLFPALKRDSTSLQVRLADDSAFTAIQASNLVLTDNTGSETATFDAQGKLSTNRTYSLTDRSGAMVLSDTTVATGADAVTNIVSLTQAEYNAIGSPDAATLYLITDP